MAIFGYINNAKTNVEHSRLALPNATCNKRSVAKNLLNVYLIIRLVYLKYEYI